MSNQIVTIHIPKKKVHVDYTEEEIRDIFKREYEKQQSLFGFFDLNRFGKRKSMPKLLHVETGADSNSKPDVSGIDQT